MKLSIATSNKNRLKVHSPSARAFFKSLEQQTCKDFEVVIADGGSINLAELKKWIETLNKGHISVRIVRHDIGDVFLRSLLNNVAVRRSEGEYILATDVDMIFRDDFVKTILKKANKEILLESKTFHLRDGMTKLIHNEKVDPKTQFEYIKSKRGYGRATSSPGGCQCMHRDNWNAIRGYDETFYGWGSEDRDLVKRIKMYGLKEIWTGQDLQSVMILHQNHPQNKKRDLEFQHHNKKRLALANKAVVNLEGWGGINEV